MSFDDLRAAALELSVKERAELARLLFESLDDSVDEDADEAWVQELNKRAAEVEEGRVETVDWHVAKERIAKRLREHRR